LKILIAGSNSILGKHLIEQLLILDGVQQVFGVNRKIGYSPESIHEKTDRSLNVYTCLDNEAYVSSLFRFIKPDVVVHLAASPKNTPEAYEENTRITNYLIKYAPKGARFIHVSCSSVELVRDYYTISKLASEQLVEVGTLAEKIIGVNVRLDNNGPESVEVLKGFLNG
jgi:nucleoside-diphosphate-sugar epimerase